MTLAVSCKVDELCEVLRKEDLDLELCVHAYSDWIEKYAESQYSWNYRILRTLRGDIFQVTGEDARFSTLKISHFQGVDVFEILHSRGYINLKSHFAELICEEMKIRGWSCAIPDDEALIRPIEFERP